MYFVWCGTRLIGMYPKLWLAKSVANARTGVSHITYQVVEHGTVHAPRHWWFL